MRLAGSVSKEFFYKFFGVFIIVLGAAGTVRSQEKISLNQAIDTALKNNLQIKQARLNEVLSQENLKSSQLALLPTLNINNGFNYSFGRNEDPFSSEFFNTKIASSSGSISSTLPVFQWSQKLKQISQNRYLLGATKSNTERIRNDVTLNVMTTYLQILFNEDLLKTSNLQLILAKQLLEHERKQFDLGNKTIVDISQSNVQVSIAELNVSNAKNQVQSLYLDLAQLLGRDPQKEFETSDLASADTPDNYKVYYSATKTFEKAVQNYPSIRMAEYQTMAAAKNIEIVRAGLMPRLSLQGGISTGYSSIRQRAILSSTGNLQYIKATPNFQLKDNLNEYLGINLSIPVFNGLNSRIALNRSKINYQSTLLAEEIEKNNLRKIINQSILDLNAAESRYQSTRTTYESSEIAYNAIKQRYDVGLVNSIVLAQAQTNMNLAQFDMIKAKYERIFKRKVIDFYMGLPVSF